MRRKSIRRINPVDRAIALDALDTVDKTLGLILLGIPIIVLFFTVGRIFLLIFLLLVKHKHHDVQTKKS